LERIFSFSGGTKKQSGHSDNATHYPIPCLYNHQTCYWTLFEQYEAGMLYCPHVYGSFQLKTHLYFPDRLFEHILLSGYLSLVFLQAN